jgi:hypothetical protein
MQVEVELAQKYGLKKQISISNENYQNCTRNLGTMKRPLQFYKKFIVYKDSLKSIEIVQKSRH